MLLYKGEGNEAPRNQVSNNIMDYYYLALTECINTGEIQMADKAYETLEQAKNWISIFEPNSHYRHHPYSKILKVNCNTLEIVQMYFRTPRNSDWYELW
jgi:hypothetical protein